MSHEASGNATSRPSATLGTGAPPGRRRERHQDRRAPATGTTRTTSGSIGRHETTSPQGATRKAAACHFWTCPAPECSGIVYRPPGEPVDCPRCGEPIECDLPARVAEQRAETERAKARGGEAMSGPAPGGARHA